MRWTVIVTLAVALLLITAQPAAAADAELEVVSKNSTNSDFDSAATLQNVTVQNGNVVLANDSIDGFEGQPADGGIPDGFEKGTVLGPSGDTYSVQTATVSEGSQAAELTASSNGVAGIRKANQPIGTTTGAVKLDIRLDPSGSSSGDVFVILAENGNRRIVVRLQPTELIYSADGGSTKTSITTAATDGEWVDITIKDIDPATDTATVEWADSDGNSGSTSIDFYSDMVSGWDTFEVYANDGGSSGKTGYLDNYELVNKTEVPSSGQYISQTHSAEQVEEGWVNLTLQNATATVEWRTDTDDDGTFETVVNSSTYSSSGNKSLGLNPQYDDWRAYVSFDAESGTTTAKYHDETLLFQASDPSGSNPDPTGEISTYDGNISLDISDEDFGRIQGDSVTVTATNSSGGTIGQTTVSSNGTVSFPYTAPPGQSDITWELSDSYDGDQVTVSQSFTLPSEVEIRNESDPSELVTLPNDTVEVRFYFDIDGDPVIVTRNASDGTVNMTGLPADRPFTIVVDGGDKFVSRRIFVESLYDRQTVYLLPENKTHVPTVFDVADYSGQYDQDESALLVQRAFNGSWGTVQGDLIGANERISTQLRVDARHRLVIVNAVTGDRKTLGPFTPVASGTQQIEITSDGEVSITGLGTQATISPDIGLLAARETTITGTVRSQETPIDNATLTVEYVDPNGSTVTLATNTISGAGDVSSTVDLSGRENGTVQAQIVYNTTAGVTGSATDTYDIRAATTNQYSLLSVLGTIPGLFPSASVAPFQVAVSLLLTLVLTTAAASKLRLPTEVSAVFVLVQLGVWSVIGWMPYTIPFAAGAAAVGLAAIRRGL